MAEEVVEIFTIQFFSISSFFSSILSPLVLSRPR
jgi:hypothetical protein